MATKPKNCRSGESPERMRFRVAMETRAIKAWAEARKVGTKPPTCAERGGAPLPSPKGSCRRRRAAKVGAVQVAA
jgi:hypothetical protein